MNQREIWNARFGAEEDYVFGTSPNAFLRAQAYRLAPASRVLAVADGEGRNGVFLAEQGHAVTAIDISQAGQTKAARLAAARGVSLDLRLADITAYGWAAECYDAVVGIFIQFAPPPLRDTILAGMKLATRPGGLLLLEGYRPEQIAYGTGGPKQAENMYTEAMLRAAFADWQIEHLAAYDAEIDEGTGHRGRSALIDLVARRPG